MMGYWMAGGGCLAMTLVAARREPHPLRAWFTSALGGIAALAAVNGLSGATGVALALNPVSGLISLVLGAPGVVAMLLLNLL